MEVFQASKKGKSNNCLCPKDSKFKQSHFILEKNRLYKNENMIRVIDGEEKQKDSRKEEDNKKNDKQFHHQLCPSKGFVQLLLSSLNIN